LVDDEPLARASLRVLLDREPDFEVVGEAASADEARRKLSEIGPDVVFVDVCLGESEGFDALDAARPHTLIVFVTAFEHYARRAFDARALDYLLKPFDDERFAQTLDRVRARARERRAHDLVSLLAEGAAAPADATPRAGRLALREGEEITLVAPDEVEWVRADDYYVTLRARGKTFLLRQSLRALEAKLDARSFVRVHRSALVHVGRVRGLRQAAGECFVVLHDGTEFRVSRSRQRAVYERFGIE
jgi:two-component system LytT family response regulator